ncbi:MAG: hypothetical protein AAFO57_07680 [Pseudomonadota bacterium]
MATLRDASSISGSALMTAMRSSMKSIVTGLAVDCAELGAENVNANKTTNTASIRATSLEHPVFFPSTQSPEPSRLVGQKPTRFSVIGN